MSDEQSSAPPEKASAPVTPASLHPAPRPPVVPAPAALVAEAAVPTPDPESDAASFGRVDDEGRVYVRTPDGEREVGSYPGSTPQEALAYFTRKYDELLASAHLLLQRVTQTDLSSDGGHQALRSLRTQVEQAGAVGDLARLDATVEQIATALKAKAQVETQQRARARQEALAAREKVVAEAEAIAAQPLQKVRWKQSTTRMRELLEEWKTQQRSGARLDKETENGLWQRFSAARNGFDKARRSHFARLDEEHATARQTKQRLVEEAERLATSTDWGPTATAFKRLMGQWRQAGRASRSEDDALWQRFKAAQDAFFAAKDEVAAAENVEHEANLKVKEALLVEAQALLPVTDLGRAKARLRDIHERWEAAGKVPRKDLDRIERAMRKVEQTIRSAEDEQWKRIDPELSARAQSMVEQLEAAVAGLERDLEKARAGGDQGAVERAQEALDARRAWLQQVRGGLDELGG